MILDMTEPNNVVSPTLLLSTTLKLLYKRIRKSNSHRGPVQLWTAIYAKKNEILYSSFA